MLNIEAFRRIKPISSVDDYNSGEGNFSPTEQGAIYRESILSLLIKCGASTVAGISQALNIPLKSVASIIQKMVRTGKIEQGDKIMGITGRSSFSYRVAV